MTALRFATPLIVAAGIGGALVAAPVAFAEPNDNSQLPSCETTGGSAVLGGQVTDCATPGNTQIDATPEQPQYGMFPWDDEFWVL